MIVFISTRIHRYLQLVWRENFVNEIPVVSYHIGVPQIFGNEEYLRLSNEIYAFIKNTNFGKRKDTYRYLRDFIRTRSLHRIFLTLFNTKKNSQRRGSRLKRLHPRLTQFLYRKLTILLLCWTNFNIDLNNATIRIFSYVIPVRGIKRYEIHGCLVEIYESRRIHWARTTVNVTVFRREVTSRRRNVQTDTRATIVEPIFFSLADRQSYFNRPRLVIFSGDSRIPDGLRNLKPDRVC